jgi:hypothetical protein
LKRCHLKIGRGYRVFSTILGAFHKKFQNLYYILILVLLDTTL